jgi:hypothetical protein
VKKRRENDYLRLTATEVARVQAAITDGVLLAQPSEEALETETVAAVGRRAVPDFELAPCFLTDDVSGWN